MNINSSKFFKNIFCKIIIAFLFIVSSLCLTACGDEYANMKLKLYSNGVEISSTGAEIVLTLENGVSSSQIITAKVEAGSGIDKKISVNVNNSKILYDKEYNEEDGSTSILLSATGVCNRALVSVMTIDGDKTESFFVTVEVPVKEMYSTTNQENLYVVRGSSVALDYNKLLQYSPSMTTQKEIVYSLASLSSYARIDENDNLILEENFPDDTIKVIATNLHNSDLSVELDLVVLDKLNDEEVEYSAKLPYSGSEVENVADGINLTCNVSETSAIDVTVKVDTNKRIKIVPYFASTLNQSSDIAIATGKNISEDFKEYTFNISSKGVVGEDKLFFNISYEGYGYNIATTEIDISTYFAIEKIDTKIDDTDTENTELLVYTTYATNSSGLCITATASPNIIPESEKVLILKLITNGTNFEFYLENKTLIEFVNNEYEFLSGEKIYIKAKDTNSIGQISIISKSNTDISKTFTLNPKVGAKTIKYTNAQIESNYSTYFLKSNSAYTQTVKFIVDEDIDKVDIIATNNSSFTINKTKTITGNKVEGVTEYQFDITSIQGASNETSILIIKHKNGLLAQAKVVVFKELVEEQVKFSVPTSYTSASVGLNNDISHLSTVDSPNLQFFVALKNSNNIELSEISDSSQKITYSFHDITTEEQDLISNYSNYIQNCLTLTGGVSGLAFTDTSNIIYKLYFSMNQISAMNTGLVWVKADVYGYSIESENRVEKNYSYYFLVEVYNPIISFSLSQTAINLYAKNSVGVEDYNLSSAEIAVNITSDATFKAITWVSNKNLVYSLNGVPVYQFIDNKNTVSIDAYSTYEEYQQAGETCYHNVGKLTFTFVGSVKEYNTTYTVSLQVNIIRAQQVEKILVKNANVEEGIYIPLMFDNQDIIRQINATAQIGESGVMAFNTNLVYEFIPYVNSYKSALSIERNTGLITVKPNSVGGAGYIRIAPADRYGENNVYDAENGDSVSVYIPITIANGNSRDTAFRITSIAEMLTFDNFHKKHFVLLINSTINTVNPYAICDNFEGGLYGILELKNIDNTIKINDNSYTTITTNKPLFKNITATGTVQNLMIVGSISGAGAVASENNGLIKDVTIDTMLTVYENNYIYSPSIISSNTLTEIGGIVGTNKASGQIIDCNFYGKIESSSATVGAIAGVNAGLIENAKAEMYRFSDSVYGQIIGTTVGGLVGEMTSGTLKNSYFYSYVKATNGEYLGLNILSGTKGGLVGNYIGGVIDKCFVYANDFVNFVGNIANSALNFNLQKIVNAYTLYNPDNSGTLSSVYVVNNNGTSVFMEYNLITPNEVWEITPNLNNNLPYFKNLLQPEPLDNIADSFSQDLAKIIAGTNKAVFFKYDTTEQSLNTQEKILLNTKNTLTFSEILGEDAYGIRAISNNENITATSNSLVINNTGKTTITLFSKYDYSLSNTFTIYVIYPINNFTLSYDNQNFGDGSSINVKITNGFTFTNFCENIILLDQEERLFNINNTFVDFDNYNAFINTQTNTINLEELSVFIAPQTRANFNYFAKIDLENITNSNFINSDLVEINNLIKSKIFGTFELNLYKGADSVTLNKSSVEIEPLDSVQVEVSIYTDLFEDDLKMRILDTNFNDFIVSENNIERISTTYYASKSDLAVVSIENARYFKITYLVTLEIKNQYKNYAFDNNKLDIQFYADSTANNPLSDTGIVGAIFELNIKAQSVKTIIATHHILNNKNLINVNNSNKVLYEYNTSATNVLVPGQEGLLKINLFPSYSVFDYVEITSSNTLNQPNLLSLGLMKIYSSGSTTKYSRNIVDFTKIPNGLRINNPYTLESNNVLSAIYLSTYLNNLITQDAIFTISINCYKNNGTQNVLVKSLDYDIIAQYLKGAEIFVNDDDGNIVTQLARGSSYDLCITVLKDQTLNIDTLSINGRDLSNLSQYNYISYSSSFEIIEDENISTTRTYKTKLHIGKDLAIEDDANFVTVQVTISWIKNGKQQTKTTSKNLGIVDFIINESKITLLTDKPDKTNLVIYSGIESNLEFDFNGNKNLGGNEAFNRFITNYYYEKLSGLSSYGDYKVNLNKYYESSLIGNISYVGVGANNEKTYTSIVNNNSINNSNPNYSNFVTFSLVNGVIKVMGKSQTTDNLTFRLEIPIQYPTLNGTLENTIEYVAFEFTIKVSQYSNEDKPLIIDNEASFIEALDGDINYPKDYILMHDLYLYDYTPRATNSIASFDGNNYTIHIMSYLTDDEQSAQEYALFTTVANTTTLKNLIVNVYHAGNILINTNLENITSVKVSGLAITNNGIIYNCSVVAYQADFTKNALSSSGLILSYSNGQIEEGFISEVAGFVITNAGYITNSRVGGESIFYVNTTNKDLSPFNITAQGNISGFVLNNDKSGYIASSYFSNGVITNNTMSSIITNTSGFVGTNEGKIYTSYSKGTGTKNYTLTGAGIATASISAGFVYSNDGLIGDCYSNIYLAKNTGINSQSGRLSAGFVYKNLVNGNIERCYTASKIQNAKSTQMSFVGIDQNNTLLNTGTILNSYYYATDDIQGNEYANTSSKINIVRILYPDNKDYFYGLTFADSATSLNGIWYSTAYGIELVSANQIAISNRYMANVVYNNEKELESYDLPYTAGYEYGSSKNPIILRTPTEFNMAFGGKNKNNQTASTSISSYYNQNSIFGNYRLICNINIYDKESQTLSSVTKTFKNGVFDGNMLTISGLYLTASEVRDTNNYGLFASVTDDAIVMNLHIEVVSVSAKKTKYVGTIAGTVENAKLINISLSKSTIASEYSNKEVLGGNIVGGLAGQVLGESEIKNIAVTNIGVQANLPGSTSQRFNRNFTDSNNLVSYAGGIIGVADIYTKTEINNLKHKDNLSTPSLAYLKTMGDFEIIGVTVGGVVAYMGPQTYLKDALLELSENTTGQKLIANGLYAGGIVGECYGDIDMARAEHSANLQQEIESSISDYYKNPLSVDIERGNMTLFESTSYVNNPKAIGGIVGSMISGKISHSYSKLNIRSEKTLYAGGIIGQIPYINSASSTSNAIQLFEVYSTGDVFAKIKENKTTGAGGIAGYIDFNRNLIFTKVNAINYFSLAYDEENEKLYLPSNIYEIYAVTGTEINGSVVAPKNLTQIATASGSAVSMTNSNYNLPIISCSVDTKALYAIDTITYSEAGTEKTVSPKGAYARASASAYYNMVEEKQGVLPLIELNNTIEENGEKMDVYFDFSDWDKNYWVRYTQNLFPSLVTYSDNNIYYIDKASDIKKMTEHPNATFIVRGKESPSTIINLKDYLDQTGFTLNNFSGVLKGMDSSLDYGFNFGGNYSFIKTLSSANIYNLTITNIGNSYYADTLSSFAGTTYQSTFENLVFKNCKIRANATNSNNNLGIMADSIVGGYVSNITFIDCSITTLIKENIVELNVGFIAGKVETLGNTFLQIQDTTAYASTGFENALNLNQIIINANGKSVAEVNAGGLIGQTSGNILVNFTANSVTTSTVKGMGILSGTSNSYVPDTIKGSNYNGLLINVIGASGNITNFNGGIMFGKVNTMSVSYLRANSYQKLFIVGGITNNNSVNINTANIGGLMGLSVSSVQVANGANFIDKFVAVDTDLEFKANTVNAGQIVGNANNVGKIDNIDTYGTITTTSKNGNSNIGGFIGVLKGNASVSNAISRTAINLTDTVYDANIVNYVGGFVGKIDTNSNTIKIGKVDNTIGSLSYDTKYLGTITIDSNQDKGNYANIGGIVGGILQTAGSSNSAFTVEISDATFGGNIIVNKSNQFNIGGMLGASSTSQVVKIQDNLAYGDIKINDNLTYATNSSYVGGVLGFGSGATAINNNYSVVSVVSEASQDNSLLFVNAVIGASNGATSTQDNYYSHQVTLCLDTNLKENGSLYAQNVYYYSSHNSSQNILNQPTILSFKAQLTQEEKVYELYEGSKLNPYFINNANFENNTTLFSQAGLLNSNKKYILLTSDLTDKNIPNLVNSHIIGDGYSMNNTTKSFIGKIDSNSLVSGVKVNAEISTSTVTTSETKTGIGALANVNNGVIYSCNVSEQTDASVFGKYGLNASAGDYIGAFVGINNGQIIDSCCDADVNGASGVVAGFVGQNNKFISNCYSTGNVTGATSFAFASGNGNILYSYTASPALSGTSSFGSNNLTHCYNDIYATGVNGGAILNTKIMSVIENTDQETKDNYLLIRDGENIIANNSASVKYGYNNERNFGYLSFCGSAFVNLNYMQNKITGTGVATSPRFINSIGKLQQINVSTTTQNYLIVNDLTKTSAMENGVDEEGVYEVKKWLAVGLSSSSFAGKISGAYNSDASSHTISNITTFAGTDYASIFGRISGATITNIKISTPSINITETKSYIAGLVSDATNSTISNIAINVNSLSTSASVSNSISGLAGKLDNTKIEGTNTITIGSISSTLSNSSETSNFSGVVGVSTNNSEVKNVTLNLQSITSKVGGKIGGISADSSGTKYENIDFNSSKLTLTQTGTANVSIGSLFGSISGGSVSDTELKEIEITANTSKNPTLGGICGTASNNVSIKDITITENITIKADNATNTILGGICGTSNSATVESLSISSEDSNLSINISADKSSSNKLGGLFGTLDNTTIKTSEISSNITISNTQGNTSYVGSLAGESSGLTLEETNISGTNSLTTKSNSVYLGGAYGKATGTNDLIDLTNTTLIFKQTGSSYIGGYVGDANNLDISFESSQSLTLPTFTPEALSIGQNAGEVYFGGFAGQISNNSTIENISLSNFVLNNSADANSINISANYVGAIAGKISGSSLSNIDVDSCYINSAENSPTANLGAITSVLSSSTISSSTISYSTITLNGTGYAGGAIGTVESGTSTLSNISFSGDISDKGISNTAIGGIVGYSNSGNLTISGSSVSGSIDSYSCAGGILGSGSVKEIKSSNNTANVSSGTHGAMTESGFNHQSADIPYAGGIVGNLTAGIIESSTNNGEITAGWNDDTGFTKLNAQDFYEYSSTHPQNIETTVTTYGADISYAGGIVGYSGNLVNIKLSTNSYNITAKAQIDLTLKYKQQGWLGYQAFCFEGVQSEKAYANGITYINNSTSTFNGAGEACNSSGSVIGGMSVKFNAFTSTKAVIFGVMDETYILDYGYNGDNLYNSFAQYLDINYEMISFGGAQAWIDANDAVGLDMVCCDENSIGSGIAVVYSDTSSIEPLTDYDYGKEIKYVEYVSGTTVNKWYYHYDESNNLFYFNDRNNNDVLDSGEAEYYSSAHGNLQTMYTSSGDNPYFPCPESLNNIYTSYSNSICNNDSASVDKKQSYVINILTKTLDSGFKVVRNTTNNGDDSYDEHYKLNGESF